jgi:hypothetical protein
MKKLLTSLLSCSLVFALLGFSGCSDTSSKKVKSEQSKKMTQKSKAPKAVKCSKSKETRKTASLYNDSESSFPDDEYEKLSFIDEQEDFVPELFDEDSTEKVSQLSITEKEDLEREVTKLVALWRAEEEAKPSDLSVNFKSLYLDEEPIKGIVDPAIGSNKVAELETETKAPALEEVAHTVVASLSNELLDNSDAAKSIESDDIKSPEQDIIA